MGPRPEQGVVLSNVAGQLAGIKGRFLLSLNDHPAVRKIFKGFRIEVVDTGYSINGRSPRAVKEVLISPKSLVKRVKPA